MIELKKIEARSLAELQNAINYDVKKNEGSRIINIEVQDHSCEAIIVYEH